jgi:predicted dehydrogenase
VSIDYASQKVELWQLKKTASDDATSVQGAPGVSIAGGEVTVANEEPLARELADFVDAVASKRAPMVTGEDGRRALALAQQIVDRMTMEMRSRPEEMRPRRHEDTKR